MSLRSNIHAFPVDVNIDRTIIEFRVNSCEHRRDHVILLHFVLHSREHDFGTCFAETVVSAEVNFPAVFIVTGVAFVVFVCTDENAQSNRIGPFVSFQFRFENICLSSGFAVKKHFCSVVRKAIRNVIVTGVDRSC
ncbi:hypothetical protein D3C80_1588930 [compost metagenome]